jgi:uncharacterized ubiquitin-like protein YukD
MDDRVVIVLKIIDRAYETDLDIPLDITVNELLEGINVAYALGIDTSNAANCFLRASNPVALLRGSKLLREYGIRNGTVITMEGSC